MSAEPLPSPSAAPARSRRAEGLSRSVLGRSGRPVLSLVASPDRAKRAPFVALVLGILLAGLVGLLLLTTASAQDAFRLHRLESSAANAADTRQALSEQVNNLTSPGGLAAQAQKMGMVPMGAPEFWKPGTPLPPGARVVDGMVVVPVTGAKPAATPQPAQPTLPAGSAGASVTSVARPGQQAPATASTKPSTSTSGQPSTKASTKATTGKTKPAAPTKAGSTSSGTTKTTKTGTAGATKSGTGTAKSGTGQVGR